jgi:hypothetical protein
MLEWVAQGDGEAEISLLVFSWTHQSTECQPWALEK